jgi:predicted NAD/FAD-binding protein
MRIAIIGSGVSGLTAAHLLHAKHDVTVFEARDRVGGHVNTIEVEAPDGFRHAIDTGFIVYNESNYPLFTKLLDRLAVPTQASNMSFGVRCDVTDLEYSSASMGTLFAQRRNLMSPGFHRMLRDILRFNREAVPAIENGSASLSMGEYLDHAGLSPRLAQHYLLPMGSALWSIPQGKVLEMPAEFFVRFFQNHGMLTVNDQPEWRVITGGSARYVEALTAPFRSRIRTSTPVKRVARHHAHVTVDGELFDHVIFACHSDQALAMLADATRREREILGALPFQKNEVVLHTDTSVLPKARRAWASWNYHVRREESAPATVTYNMNKLQTLEATETYCVTLNNTESIDPDAILYRTHFSHPMYTLAGMQAQQRRGEISGEWHTHYCGAYWGFGFHEDGVRSAVEVAKRFGAEL